MNEDSPVTTGGEVPVAVTPTPVPQDTPVAPSAPSQEPTSPSQDNGDQAGDIEAKEWQDAENEIFPGLRPSQKKEPKLNEQTQPEKDAKKTSQAQPNSEDKKPNEEPKLGDDPEKQGEDAEKDGKKPDDRPADAAVREARATARQIAQQQQAVKTDVRAKMFADVPDTLVDQDGDAIRSVEDVMELINPSTGEAFTQEEAAAWLSQAQRQFDEQRSQIEQNIEKIADLNLQIKDEADAVTSKYGEWLKAHPDIRDALWTEFQESLQKDGQSGIITGMPLSLGKYYDRALAPYTQTNPPSATTAPEAVAISPQTTVDPAQAQAEAERAKQQSRADRSDIYAPPQPDTTSSEDKEWAEAAKAVFGSQLSRGSK